MHYFVVRGAEPSLVLVAVVWYALRSGSARATVYGLVAGIAEDILAFDSGGAWTFSTTIVALVSSLPARRFFVDSIPLFAIVTALATLVREAIFWIIKKAEGYPAGLGTIHFHEALVQALLNAVVAAVVTTVARRFERRETAKRLR